MAKKMGLDHRRRDEGGEIRHKRGDTHVGALRRTYGAEFAAGHRSDMKLETLLKKARVKTLSEYLKKHR